MLGASVTLCLRVRLLRGRRARPGQLRMPVIGQQWLSSQKQGQGNVWRPHCRERCGTGRPARGERLSGQPPGPLPVGDLKLGTGQGLFSVNMVGPGGGVLLRHSRQTN
jgi:hypothetical protein